MTQSTLQSRQSERGFTLVELAIVMIIIGLLIGGILKGQELINNARVSSTVAQIKAVESGISAFRDKYAGIPGDIAVPTSRIAGCTGALCILASAATNGDSKISIAAAGTSTFNPGLAPNATSESAASFVQLAAAGMIGGVQPSAAALLAAASNPTTPLGGAWVLGTSDGVASGMVDVTGLSAGIYMVSSPLITAPIPVASNAQVMTPVAAANIDRKVDDGLPNTGIVRHAGNAIGPAACADTIAGVISYNEALGGTLCGVFAKVQ